MKAEEKIAGGKLLRIELSGKAKITGDFFIHPEEAIKEIEKILENPQEDERGVEKKISELVRSKGILMVGISPADIARVYWRARCGG